MSRVDSMTGEELLTLLYWLGFEGDVQRNWEGAE